MEELPEMPVLDIPMLQPTPKAEQTDTTPSPKEAKADKTHDQAEADFDSAYAQEADNQSEKPAEEAVDSDGDSERAAKSETPNTEDEAPQVTFADTEDDTPESLTSDPEKGEAASDDKGTKKPVADSHELAFAQRLLSTRSADHRGEPAPDQQAVVSDDPKRAKGTIIEGLPRGEKQAATAKDQLAVKEPVSLQKTVPAAESAGRPPENPTAKVTLPAAAVQNSQAQAMPGQIPAMTEDRVIREKTDPRAADAEPRIAPVSVSNTSRPATKTPSATATLATSSATPAMSQLTAQADLTGLEQPMSVSGDVEAPALWDARGSSATTLTQTLARPETPSMIGRQMAEALQRLPDRPVELSLNPEELGRVRLSISVAEGGITVSVLAERPETLDLMRRHIDQLAREFQALGYENIGFAFNEGQTGSGKEGFGDPESPSASRDQTGISAEEPVATTITLTPASGVDMRL
ncbi:flagellar hook-length control protein FliK [Roseobacter sp. YSTF-M11]|uniref:Flagellar hook-length control protein FliK n=1 Tax=Roseobacter insulae TaxID=2859783 RepID=A0A9X1JX88_9RHOB|nr:flagellar hook-length control protein FliK [Roseobacter insulae]MBW4706965.1 flagellar hook-length control protein FliK [Roseobacter insulae]